jgi:hypothetical protein
MRVSFRWLLPAAQITFAIILLALWSYTLHQFASTIQLKPFSSEPDLEHADTGSFNRLYRVDGFASCWSVETNLPAMPVLIPIYRLLTDRIPAFHQFKTAWRISGFCLAGIGIWFFVGRFVDDVLAAFRGGRSPRKRIWDVLFFLYIVISSLLVFAGSEVFGFVLHFDVTALRFSSMCWLAAGCTALLLQVRWAMKRRAPAVGAD